VHDPFSPESLTLGAEPVECADPKPARKRGKPFKANYIQFPMLWAECLISVGAGANAWRVAYFLLHEVFRTGDDKVRLSNVALVKWGVSRKGKATALSQLRRAGLISAEELGHASPLVTVRYPEV
jgi:hypothetical protein